MSKVAEEVVRFGWKGHWTLQMAGKAPLQRPLDAAGRGGRLLKGAGGSFGTVRKNY